MRHRMQPWYTDNAVAIGPNIRWTMDDTQDLMEAYPEVFLGYCVHLETIDTVRQGGLRGRRPLKIVLFDGVQRERGWADVWYEVMVYKNTAPHNIPMKIEAWHVHRVRGIYRMDIG